MRDASKPTDPRTEPRTRRPRVRRSAPLLLATLAISLAALAPAGAAPQTGDPAAGADPAADGPRVEVEGSVSAAATPEPPAAEPRAAEPRTVEPFDAAAATEAYLATVPEEVRQRSDAYFEGGYWLQLWGLLYTLGVAWLLLGSGLSRRLRDLAERLTRRKPLQTAFYGAGYVVLTTVLSFPLTLYAGFFREHAYGLATQTIGPWLTERMIGLAVSIVLISLLLVPLYGVFRRAERTWWLWGSGVAVLFLVFGILIAPVYIDPLFNTYEPLDDPEVREPILSMARANGIPAEEVWQFDASRQSKRISANVSGFAGTMRIRLNDNLLERTSQAEIEAVMGHEIGHYALNHIYESILFLGVVLVAGFGFVRWSFDRVLRRWGSPWGVRGIGDVAGLPLLVALFAVYFFALTPVMNGFIRSNEAEADLYGLNAARQPEGFAEVSLKLAEYRKLDPSPLEEMLMYDHPSGRSRISMAMAWKAENPDP